MRKVIMSLSVVIILLLGMGTSVLASNQDFKFIVSSGGTSDYTYSTKKSDSDCMWYITPKLTSPSYPGVTSNWQIGETIRMRVRDNATRSSYSNLELLKRRSDSTPPGTGVGTYGVTEARSYSSWVSGNSISGKYFRLYVDKASSDPYSTLTLVGTWCP